MTPDADAKSDDSPSEAPSLLPEGSAASKEDEAAIQLAAILQLFWMRQVEILRIARFIEQRSAEMDNAANRAKELIQTELGDNLDGYLDEDGLDAVFELVKSSLDGHDGGGLTDDERFEALLKAIQKVEEILPEGHQAAYFSSVATALSAPSSVDVLMPSLLVSLVGELESSVRETAKVAVIRNPGIIFDGKKTFTWKELMGHDTLESFKQSAIDSAIEEVLRGSLQDWMDFFANRIKIPPIEVVKTFEAQEIVQRRHCIVHNSGKASEAYIRQLDKYPHEVKLDDALAVDSTYLQSAADELLKIVYSLIWALGFQICKSSTSKRIVENALSNQVYYLLQHKRYDVAITICEKAPIDRLPDRSALMMRFNLWLAHKLRGTFDEVRQFVIDFDVSAKSREFKLAKHALLDEHEEASDLVDSMLEVGDLRHSHYLTWPLLSGVRRYRRSRPSDVGVDHPAGLLSYGQQPVEGTADEHT